MASQDSIGMQKKIIDLDPYKASVVETVAEDSETGKTVVVGQETVFRLEVIACWTERALSFTAVATCPSLSSTVMVTLS